MAQIVLMIPRRDDISQDALRSRIKTVMARKETVDLEELPFIAGECQIEGFRNLIIVENVSWETEVEEDLSAEGRRTVHSPKVSVIKLKRRVDLATAHLTRAALNARVSQLPWELYFLRAQGGEDIITGKTGVMQSVFMTLRLHFPLVSKYSFSIDEGEGTEDIEVSATAMEWEYAQTDELQRVVGMRWVEFDLQAGVFSDSGSDD